MTASVAGSVRAEVGEGMWVAHMLSGHQGTACWTLLLTLISFNQLCQLCFLAMMEELDRTRKESLRRSCGLVPHRGFACSGGRGVEFFREESPGLVACD